MATSILPNHEIKMVMVVQAVAVSVAVFNGCQKIIEVAGKIQVVTDL